MENALVKILDSLFNGISTFEGYRRLAVVLFKSLRGGFIPFSKVICLIVNVIARLDFKLANSLIYVYCK